jgi:hypothetical protein
MECLTNCWTLARRWEQARWVLERPDLHAQRLDIESISEITFEAIDVYMLLVASKAAFYGLLSLP